MSYEKKKATVEQYFADEFPYIIMSEMRRLELGREGFAEYVGISVEQLDNYRNNGGIPRGDTLIKLISKCGLVFLQDVIATAGVLGKYSIISNNQKQETGTSIVANRRG